MDKRVNPISPAAQLDLGLGSNPEQLQRKKPAAEGYKEIHAIHNPTEKDPKGKAAENKEFEDKRVKSSPLNVNAEIARMKEALDKSSKSGYTGVVLKSNRDITKNYKAGGRVSSASKRADGIAIRGRTRA
jgi:hypothetical protein